MRSGSGSFAALLPALVLIGGGLFVVGGSVISPDAGPGAHPLSRSIQPVPVAPAPGVARDAFLSTIEATQQVAGGAWQKQDDSRARGCELRAGGSGRAFPALRVGDAPNDPAVVVDAVTAAWQTWGYTVEPTTIGPVAQLIATNDAGESLIFRASSRAMTLQGESECVPA